MACAGTVNAGASESILTIDRFEDGGFSLFSDGTDVTSDTPASVIGGQRTVTFLNVNLDGTLTLDDALGTLTHDTDGNGQYAIGYGYENSGGGIQPDFDVPLDLDLSSFEFLRIHIVENESSENSLRFFIRFNTYGDTFQTSNDVIVTPAGFEGEFEVDLSALPGDADFADIDSFSVGALNAFTGFGFTLGGFELVDTDPPLFCAGDCDDSGSIDFGDLVAMLGQFGNDTGDGCDADESGSVDFGDLVTALGLFGPCS